MARHIMAVCVVCLLCADHLPCQQHVESLLADSAVGSTTSSGSWQHTLLNEVLNNKQSTTNTAADGSYVTTDSDNRSRRKKRHDSHSHNHASANSDVTEKPEITVAFLKRIFNEYGSGDTISVQDFQRMLEKLGLKELLRQTLHNSDDNETCIRDSQLMHYVKPHPPSVHDHMDVHLDDHTGNHHHHPHHHSPTSPAEHHDYYEGTNCSDSSEGCALARIQEQEAESENLNYTLTSDDFINVCPILLYQLTSTREMDRRGCIDTSILMEIKENELKHVQLHKEDIMLVWIYSFTSVFACSILGLVGVAIIPFMNSRFYKHIIQFLVSLAVGTMTGDALLHLLPHSLAGQNESNMIFKGLTCMGGIVFFYITEHSLTMVSEWRKSIAKKETTNTTRAKVMRDPDSSHNNSVAGDKVCKSKYSSYPYCYDEIAMDTKNDVWLHMPNNVNADGTNHSATRNGKVDTEHAENASQSLLSTSQNNYAPIAERNHRHHAHHHHNDLQQPAQMNQHAPDSSTLATDLDGNVVGDGVHSVVANANGKDMMNDTVTVILREHESSHHGHSHKHGHVHSPPESLSAVVWMIIMGDGLHNFTDGMAIGAAFAENIAGGFSTALAVFCHELPHELGDFAILMKAGMSVKSAVYYNLLTGVLSFVGMVFGIVFGQSHEAAQWMFAAAAGLFIYIAMVDMMPEISAAHKSVQQFALQILGMSSGVLLMLLIAIFEGDLMTLFSTN